MNRSKDECICGSRRHKSKWINCDRCRQWFHLVCARVTEDDLDKIVKFCCYMCTKRDGGLLTIFRCQTCAGCLRQHDCGFCVSCLADSKKICDKRRCALEKNDPYAHIVLDHSGRKSTISSKENTPVKAKRPYKKRGRKPKAESARVAKGSISLSNYGRSPNASRKAKESIEGTRPYYIPDMTEDSDDSSEEDIPIKKKPRKTSSTQQIVLKQPKLEPSTPPPAVPKVYKKRGRKSKAELEKLAELNLLTLPSFSNTPPLLSTPSQSPPFLVPSLPSTSESKALEPPLLSPAITLKQRKKCNGCDRNARKNSDFCSNRCWFKKETGQITASKIILESHLRSATVQCRTGFANPSLASVKPVPPKPIKKNSYNNQSKTSKSASSSSSYIKPINAMAALKI